MISDTIKKIRMAVKMTQAAFAEAVKVEQSYVSKLELGKVNPSYGVSMRILKLATDHRIRVKLEDLFVLE